MILYGHPFSSYTWKALIAFHETETPVEFRELDPRGGAHYDALKRMWPLAKFPLVVDGDVVLWEASVVVEHVHLAAGARSTLLPADPAAALQVRKLDRIFDSYVMNVMQVIVSDALRPADSRDPYGVAKAREGLDDIYAWLDAELAEPWAAPGDAFSLADCAAAPSLFYADWAHPIPKHRARLKAYRARLLARPSVARCVEAARPFRAYFPLGAPDRD